jgi:hypothetical protein
MEYFSTSQLLTLTSNGPILHLGLRYKLNGTNTLSIMTSSIMTFSIMSLADACTYYDTTGQYCIDSVVLISSQIYLYSSYFGHN